ncbi:MAG: HAMP domain-containing histidine kinase [Polyangiaceae bacterium]|nr:HAMP domain-containing histidine kinase [Polyangiaceae bacterium]
MTLPRLLSDVPPSGERARSPADGWPSAATRRRLLALAADTPPNATAELLFAPLLAELAGLEPGAAAALRLAGVAGGEPELCWCGAVAPAPGAPAGDRLFAGLPLELQVSVPGQGELAFAAPALGPDAVAVHAAALEEAAVLVAVVWRAVRQERVERLHAQRDKLAVFGELAAGILHELNNPLTAIVAYAEMLLRTLPGRTADAVDLERLAHIRESSQRLIGFARDLVSYTRPDAQPTSPLELDVVLDRALGYCGHLLVAHGVTLRRDRAPGATVACSPSALTQAFVNLVTNAVQAMEGLGGELVVTAARDGQRVRVTVADEGVGIAESDLERIFEPYVTTKPHGHGAGLGLSIVRGIVADHGGRVSARRRTPRGAVFEVELPVDRSGHAGHDPA